MIQLHQSISEATFGNEQMADRRIRGNKWQFLFLHLEASPQICKVFLFCFVLTFWDSDSEPQQRNIDFTFSC